MHLRNKVLALIDVLEAQRIVSDELDVVVMSDAARAIVPDTWNRQGLFSINLNHFNIKYCYHIPLQCQCSLLPSEDSCKQSNTC